MKMAERKIRGYLINAESGRMIGVNSFGWLIANLSQKGKNITEIAKICQKLQNCKEPLEVLEKKIFNFVMKMKREGFPPEKIRAIPLDNPSVPPLLMAQLDISWVCNLRCRHCYLGDTELIDEPLAKEEWKSVINQLYEMGVPKIAFLGGEPLLSPMFFELAEYAFRLGFKLYTTTNGTLVTPVIAKRLAQVGFNEIDVSLDGATPETHEFLRGEGTFEKTVQGIQHLVTAGLKVKSATVVSKKNMNEILSLNLMELGRKLGLHHMYLNPLLPGGKGKEIWKEYEVSAKDWLEVKKAIQKWNSKGDLPKVFAESGFVFDDKLMNRALSNPDICVYAGCKAGKREMIITPDGFAVACPLLSTEREFQTMSVRKYSLREIWEKDEWIVKLRSVNENTIQGKCKNCRYRTICKGGCHILALFEYGNINQPDPRCPLEGDLA
jgi:radical SAM protein with 4Fe4S-binding SPASM domain